MNEALIISLITMIQGLLSQSLNSQTINNIINGLIAVVKLLDAASGAVIASVQNIISTLQSKSDLTAAQLDALDRLSDEVDALWDKTIADYVASKKKLAMQSSTQSQLPLDQPS